MNNGKDKNKGRYFSMKNEEKPVLARESFEKERKKRLIQKRRKLKKSIFIAFGIFILISLLLLSPIFKIKNITFSGIVTMNEATLKEELKGFVGRSIFLYNKKELKNILLKHTNIEAVDPKASVNGTLKVNLTEAKADFGIALDSGMYLVNKDLKILNKVDKLPDDLVKVSDDNDMVVYNNEIQISKNKKEFLKSYFDLMNRNQSTIKFTQVDVSDSNNITLYYKNFDIQIGSSKDLESKLNKAINMLKKPEVDNMSGSIILKFNANPVIQTKPSSSTKASDVKNP